MRYKKQETNLEWKKGVVIRWAFWTDWKEENGHQRKNTEEIIYYEYRIQDHILAGWKVYQIRFQDDLVADTSIIVEDW